MTNWTIGGFRGTGIKIGFNNNIGSRLHVADHASVGSNNYLGRDVYIGEYTAVGSNNRLEKRVKIHPWSKIGNGCNIGSGTMISGSVRIGNSVSIRPNSRIGHQAILEDNVELPNRYVVEAMAHVYSFDHRDSAMLTMLTLKHSNNSQTFVYKKRTVLIVNPPVEEHS